MSPIKISYISDLHLDFWVPFVHNQFKFEQRTKDFIMKLIETDRGNRDAICLCGDYSHFNIQTLWMLEIFAKHYKKVFLIFGNHDYYLVSKSQANKYKNNSINRIKEVETELLSHPRFNNVHLFKDDKIVNYKGIKFGGNTMWYPLESVQQQMFFSNISNDSRLIRGLDIQVEHEKSITNYNSILKKNIDVMLSHVPLIHIKSHELYGSTSCYYTPVEELPKHVIQAHSHERAIYKKAGSLLHMNCLGYPQDGLGEPKIMSFEI